MAAIKIPLDNLSPDTLHGVILDFVSRDGTDYGKTDVSLETKISQVKRQLESGLAVLLYDDETRSCNIFSRDDPVLRALEE